MLNSLKGRKIHTRNIQISTYETDTENLIVEGILKDNLLISHYHTSGEKHSPNTVHHMVVRMLIGTTSFKIEDIEVEMPVFPQKDCGETSKSLDQIKGIKIAPGFTEKVKNMLGGTYSCSHLKTLVLSMASAAVQGFWVHRTKEPKSDDSTSGVTAMYLIKDEKKCLIDGGTRTEAKRIINSLKEMNAFPPDMIIVTHSHWDHTQAIPTLRKEAAKLGKTIEVTASEAAITNWPMRLQKVTGLKFVACVLFM